MVYGVCVRSAAIFSQKAAYRASGAAMARSLFGGSEKATFSYESRTQMDAATDGDSIAESQEAITNVREAIAHLLGPDFNRRPPDPPPRSSVPSRFQRLSDHKWIFLRPRATNLLSLQRRMGRIDLLDQVRAHIVRHHIFFSRKFPEKVRSRIAEFVAERLQDKPTTAQ